jgi:hypothetical protein
MEATRVRKPVFQGIYPVTSAHQAGIEYAGCPHCTEVNEARAKYCGSCGYTTRPPQEKAPLVDPRAVTIPNFGGTGPLTAPNFATVTASVAPKQSSELQNEMMQLQTVLLRERMLLALHWATLIGSNLIGFWLAMKCHHEFIGDEVTRMVIASTPLLFINTCGLLCIVTIKGTRKEIARLKERISYVKFKLEYGHLI